MIGRVDRPEQDGRPASTSASRSIARPKCRSSHEPASSAPVARHCLKARSGDRPLDPVVPSAALSPKPCLLGSSGADPCPTASFAVMSTSRTPWTMERVHRAAVLDLRCERRPGPVWGVPSPDCPRDLVRSVSTRRYVWPCRVVAAEDGCGLAPSRHQRHWREGAHRRAKVLTSERGEPSVRRASSRSGIWPGTPPTQGPAKREVGRYPFN